MRSRAVRWTGAAGAVALALAATALVAPGAAAAPVVHGAVPAAAAPLADPTPVASTQLWFEDFQNNTSAGMQYVYTATPRYRGASAAKSAYYIGNTYWTNPAECNGLVLTDSTAVPATCLGSPAQSWKAQRLHDLAYVLGQVGGVTPGSNGAVGYMTVNSTTANLVLATNTTLALTYPTEGTRSAYRFLGYRYDTADISCDTNQRSSLQVQLSVRATTAEGPWTNAGPYVEPCSASGARTYTGPRSGLTVHAGRFQGPSAQRVAATQRYADVRFVTSILGGLDGDDFGIDNVGLYDQTPQVEASFSPTSAPARGTSTLTLTVRNTTERSGKSPLAFTHTLPAGLVVAGEATSTCGGTTTAATGATTVGLAGGALADGSAGCTITVPVRPATPPTSTTTYTNGTFTAVNGVDSVAAAPSVTFYPTALTITKSLSPAQPRPGSTVTYTVTATNTGEGAFTADYPAVLVDDLGGVLDDASLGTYSASDGALTRFEDRLIWTGPLAQGAAVTLTYTVTVPSPLRATGDAVLTNVAFNPTPADRLVASMPTSCTTDEGYPCVRSSVPIPEIRLTKSGTVTGDGLVTYTFDVSNTGGDTLTDVQIADPGAGPVTFDGHGAGEAITLGARGTPTATATGTATHQATTAEIDAGQATNTATVTGSPTSGAAVTDTDSATVALSRVPALSVVKHGRFTDGDGLGAQAGDTVDYTYTITNEGNTTLHGVAVTADTLIDPADITPAWPGDPGVLAPGQDVTATATHTLTQAEVDAGHVVNRATASGTPPVGDAVTAHSETLDLAIGQNAAVSVTKAHRVSGPAGETPVLGSTVTYTFTVENTGNLTLYDAQVTDPRLTGGPFAVTPAPLAPGQTGTATATHLITQADVDAGGIENTATVSASDAAGGPLDVGPEPSNDDTLVIPTAPALTLGKTAALGPSAHDPVRAGDPVDYTFAVTNTGDVTLHGVAVQDPSVPGAALSYDWPGDAGVLGPGDQVTATATVHLTQAQVDAGAVHNEATATGVPPGAVGPTSSVLATADVTLASAPAIRLTGTAAVPDGTVHAGDAVTFRYTTTNTGNVTLALRPDGLVVPEWCDGTPDPDPPATLAPGDDVVQTLRCTLSQAQVDAGTVSGPALVVGAAPGEDPVTDTASPSATITAHPGLTLTKHGSRPGGTPTAAAGDGVLFGFTAENVGNVTLSAVQVQDALDGVGPVTVFAWPAAGYRMLAPGDTVDAQADYAVTQADVDAGAVTNHASASGTTPDGGTTRAVAHVTVRLPEDADIALRVSGAAPTTTMVGAVVTFTYRVTNPGHVTLHDVDVTDPMPGLSTPRVVAWPGATGDLAPGGTVVATATYALTAADVRRGSVSDPATATGVTGQGTHVSATADTTVVLRTLVPPSPIQPIQPIQPSPVPPVAGGSTGGSTGALPTTGASAAPLALLAALLLTAGLALVLRRRT